MIRVLHVIGVMDRGGAETMIMNFYRKIDKSKFLFDFLVHQSKEGDFDKEIKELGANIYFVPSYFGYNQLSYKKAVKEFFEKHHDYDIVHGHITSSINIYLNEAKKYGIRTIAHSHSANFGVSLTTFLINFISKKTIHIADYFFGCSKKAGLDRYGKIICDSDRFFVINNGIDAKKYVFNSNTRQQLIKKYQLEGKKVFGHVGRFTKAKNHDFLIRIFYEIQNIEPNSVLLLAGRGEMEDDIRQQVKSFDLEDKVHFLGVIPDVYNILNVFDVFIFPSLYEGLGIALVEAQASDLPCVVNETLPNEVFMSDKVCKMSLKQSPKEWADKCVSLVDSPRKDSFYLIKEKGFDINASLEFLLKCYCDLVQK